MIWRYMMVTGFPHTCVIDFVNFFMHSKCFDFRDQEGNFYFDPVFNETVSIVEYDDGFDSEVFFMYVFLAAGAILLLFLIYTLLTRGKKLFSPKLE